MRDRTELLAEHERPRPLPQVFVVAGNNAPVTDGQYAFHQGDIVERGRLDATGRAAFSRIDPARPFVFEVRDRVCAIREGAFLNPDDPRIEYGGTWFDWSVVRDNVAADKVFWPHYQKEMDREQRSGVDYFMQHEHITRRPIQIAKPVLIQLGKVTIRATPARVRVGPFVRYTDHERAVIWLETVTPTMVRVRHRTSGASTESFHYGSTVRVGGRYFAAVEIGGLAEETFYDYTVDLAPLPASGTAPTGPQDVDGVFPPLTASVAAAMAQQFTVPSLTKTPWLAFRTLRRRYDKQLRFATGSCRWYPGDTDYKERKWGPDMLEGLGNWVRTTRKEQWPQFLFFGGDQIYADEIGFKHGKALTSARFAARLPGPVDRGSLGDKLVDGAWAGRFAHRFHPYKDPDPRLAGFIADDLKKIDEIHKQYPDLKEIYLYYPTIDRKAALKQRYDTLRNRRQLNGAKAEDSDERQARQSLEAVVRLEALEARAEHLRAARSHWDAAALTTAKWRNSMSTKYLVHNFALWSIPDFERDLPIITSHQGWTIARTPSGRSHPSAERGVHAADFAEYAYLYQRAWTSSPTIRMLLAHVPTFLMFDDHEATDDWNFDAEWVRMLHNPKDDYQMWPKTLTDALAAYWMYQGWCNKAPSQWPANDPRVKALADAKQAGIDALPALRKCIHTACFTPQPRKDPAASYQAGLSLDWHYRLPFDPPFLVPDCRTRKRMVPSDDQLRVIDHEDAKKAPLSQTIDDAQLAWMRTVLVDQWRGGRVAFIAPSTPLLLKKKFMTFMQQPEVAAGAWARGGDLAGGLAVLFDSTKAAAASDATLRVFRRRRDLEHMIRDKSWRDMWTLVDDMRKKGSGVKTLVLVSGDVHHSYCMTGNFASTGRSRPEIVQITCSGFQTTIRGDTKSWLAEQLSSLPFRVGKRQLVPGFVLNRGAGRPDLVLFENAAALVDVRMGLEVDVLVTYLTASEDRNRQVPHVYKYTSGAAYMKNGEPAVAWEQLAQDAGAREIAARFA